MLLFPHCYYPVENSDTVDWGSSPGQMLGSATYYPNFRTVGK